MSIPPTAPAPLLSFTFLLETDIPVESALEDSKDKLEAPAEADDVSCCRAKTPLAVTEVAAAAAALAEVDEDVECRDTFDDPAVSRDDDEAVSLGRNGLDADR